MASHYIQGHVIGEKGVGYFLQYLFAFLSFGCMYIVLPFGVISIKLHIEPG